MEISMVLNFDLLLDRLDTFSSPCLLVFKLESVPRYSGIFQLSNDKLFRRTVFPAVQYSQQQVNNSQS